MLDDEDPLSLHIFAAARAETRILTAAKKMTVAARQERVRLLDDCTSALEDLRQLGRDHFANCPEIPSAIDALKQSLEKLASLPRVPEQGPRAEDKCPACGRSLDRRGIIRWIFVAQDSWDIYCIDCLDIIMPSLGILESSERGFGSDSI